MAAEDQSAPRFSRQAYRSYFRLPTYVVVEERLIAAVEEFLPSGVATLVMTEDARVFTQDEILDGGDIETPLTVDFSPVGCMAMWVTEKTAAAAEQLKDWYRRSEADIRPPVLLLDPANPEALAKSIAKTIPTLMRRLQHGAIRLGNRDEQIAHLRRKTESLLTGMGQVQQKMDGMGIDRNYIALSIPRGPHSIGPGGTIGTVSLCQKLPVDVFQLAEIELQVVGGSSDSKGTLTITLVREADDLVLDSYRVAAADLDEGWYGLPFSAITAIEPGEAHLRIDWHIPAGEEAPRFALADVDAEATFGARVMPVADHEAEPVELDAPLAMRIFRQVREQIPTLASNYDYADAYWNHAVALADFENDYVFDTDAEETAVKELGGHPLSRMDDEGYWQTHPVQGHWVGFRIPNALSMMDERIQFEVKTEHKLGPETHYRLLVVKSGAAIGEDGQPVDPADALGVADVSLPAEEGASLIVTLDKPIDQRADIIGLVELVGTSKSFGWCRWRNLLVGRPSYNPHVLDRPDRALLNPADRFFLRSFRFPDLRQNIEFVGGADDLKVETKEAGFSPIMVMEDGSYMQVHPLMHRLSAAVVPGGVPADAQRILSDVRSAHHGTPMMMYALAAIAPKSGESDPAALEAFLTGALTLLAGTDGDLEPEIDFDDDHFTGRVAVRAMRALEKDRLSLDVSDLGASDAVFAVLPMEGAISFGWCRWYSYHIEIKAGG